MQWLANVILTSNSWSFTLSLSLSLLAYRIISVLIAVTSSLASLKDSVYEIVASHGG